MTPPRRILLVDDDPDALRTYADILAAEGYEVATATSGEEALARINGYRPDIILLDIMLPGQNGVDVARTLAARPDARDIPIVAITAYSILPEDARVETVPAIRRLIYKPCRPRTLLECLDDVLRYGR